ncbi:MAG: 16S rRNA processing protein RimM [Bacteroidaceae bacterium]|nr:16S rRNA processing protein RimM [Bacteroidaceae bacterium]MBP5322953.1 16S rRNA processing protein RimM [Bacteroidaceae bacterium]
MIKPEEVICIGKFTRTHGVKGEIAMSFTNDVFDRTDCPYLVCSMDGILVPFFIEEYRFKSDTVALIKFEKIDTIEQARQLTNKEALFPTKYIPEDEEQEYTWLSFIGYEVEDTACGYVGKVVDVDDSTINVLFIVEREDGKEVFIPAQEALIEDIDHEKRSILFNLPEGLLE